MIAALLIILYIIFSVLTYGITYGFFRQEYPNSNKNTHRYFAALFSLIPFGLIIAYFLSGKAKNGLKFK